MGFFKRKETKGATEQKSRLLADRERTQVVEDFKIDSEERVTNSLNHFLEEDFEDSDLRFQPEIEDSIEESVEDSSFEINYLEEVEESGALADIDEAFAKSYEVSEDLDLSEVEDSEIEEEELPEGELPEGLAEELDKDTGGLDSSVWVDNEDNSEEVDDSDDEYSDSMYAMMPLNTDEGCVEPAAFDELCGFTQDVDFYNGVIED